MSAWPSSDCNTGGGAPEASGWQRGRRTCGLMSSGRIPAKAAISRPIWNSLLAEVALPLGTATGCRAGHSQPRSTTVSAPRRNRHPSPCCPCRGVSTAAPRRRRARAGSVRWRSPGAVQQLEDGELRTAGSSSSAFRAASKMGSLLLVEMRGNGLDLGRGKAAESSSRRPRRIGTKNAARRRPQRDGDGDAPPLAPGAPATPR